MLRPVPLSAPKLPAVGLSMMSLIGKSDLLQAAKGSFALYAAPVKP